MLRPLLALPVLALAACAAPPGSAAPVHPPRMDYTIRIADPAAERVEVELRLGPLPDGTESITLALPERYAFVKLDAPLLEGPPEAHDAEGRRLPVETLSPFRWRVRTGGATELRVRLAVPLSHREIPAVRERDCYEFPYLAADHGMLVAGSMLPAPEGLAGRVRLRFELPAGWPVRCPWPEVAPGVYQPDPDRALQDDLFAVGRWQEQVIDANGCQVTVAVAPGQDGLLETAGPIIERIVRAEIELFGCVPREKYLFLFGRPDPPPAPGERGLSLAGSPKSGSMTLMVRGVGEGIDPARHLGHLIAHEFHHTWASARVELPDELRFVGEGFTDYYAYLVLARERMISWEEFAEVLSSKLRDYLGNPTRGQLSLCEAGGPVFYEGGGAYAHTYDGGLLFAALVDREIRAANDGHSLDDLMRAFYNDPRWQEAETNPTFDDFYATLAEFLDAEDLAQLKELAQRREGIDFATLLTATGAPVTVTREPARPSLRANLDGTRIRDIDPSGLGARLGLQPGDILLEVNGIPCESPGDVHRAWRAPQDGRIRITFERKSEHSELDQPLPEEATVTLDAAPWRTHLATTADR